MGTMLAQERNLIRISPKKNLLFIEFTHPKNTNPFSRLMTQELIKLLPQIEADESIHGVVMSGGKNRSFSAGGDFSDVSKLKEKTETENYLLEIIDLYVALLNFTKPLITAIDHYAIGQGLQVALMSDWRVASTRSKFAMPELKNGVACPLGSLILETLFGRARMLQYVYACTQLNSAQALKMGLINARVNNATLLKQAEKVAVQLCSYPAIPFRKTKKIHNSRLIAAFNQIRPAAADAHVASILARSGMAHFEKVLNK